MSAFELKNAENLERGKKSIKSVVKLTQDSESGVVLNYSER